ncbi:MAG TPA: ATP-binding protein [Myxococcota bacterium]|nr:ATP-binding protein [Myxococcota bacterium]
MVKREPLPSNAPQSGGDAPWLRFALWFIPESLRADPDAYRRARTTVYSCCVPVLLTPVFAWSYATSLARDTAPFAISLVLGSNAAAAGALVILRKSGRIERAANLLLAYVFVQLTALASLFGGPFSSSIYWTILLPLVAMLTGGPRLALPWLLICMAEYGVVYALQCRGIEFHNRLPLERRAPLWASSISSIALLCLLFVLIYERAKQETLRALGAANLELERARDAAEAANRSKSDFLANVSHEIRVPLTAILGYAELLMREGEAGALPSRYVQTLGTIRRNGEHLLSIINDILDFSKIAAGQFDLEETQVSPVELVTQVVGLMGNRAEAKGLMLSVESAPELPEVITTDPRRLHQVLVNLLGNALKFTDSGSIVLRVTPGGSSDRPRIRFEVRDSGIGISREQMARLFQPFAQADASTARRYGGTGLGLSISKRLVELLGGTIGAESRLGSGSTFWVELPLAAEKHADA